MKPLAAAAKESYDRSYPFFLQLHMLQELELGGRLRFENEQEKLTGGMLFLCPHVICSALFLAHIHVALERRGCYRYPQSEVVPLFRDGGGSDFFQRL